ncbi:MAG: redoxin domain-containing protein [Acidobacteria bacterium]|nr:redoxin domain-containing protein [Acidobacteriota bacterium]
MQGILLFFLLVAVQQPLLGPVDGEVLAPTEVDRINVGVVAPDFQLMDEQGTIHKLSDYRGKKNVVLVFYRGNWCGQCAAQFGELRVLLDDDAKAKTQILAVSPDDNDGGLKMVERVTQESGGPPGFPLLADPEFKVINRYGVFNPNLFNGHPVPYPTVFVIDRSGKVIWKHLDTQKQTRPSNADILKSLAELDRK